jgi:hypothetical protein
MKQKKYKKYRAREGLTILLETNDLEKAKEACRKAHRKNPSKYHEVHKYDQELKYYVGIYQFEPNDKIFW